MIIREIIWDADTILHIARHGVEPDEVEKVCFQGSPFIFRAGENRFFALGQTQSGRYLTIIFEYLGKNKAKVITARAMSNSERRFYKKRGKKL